MNPEDDPMYQYRSGKGVVGILGKNWPLFVIFDFCFDDDEVKKIVNKNIGKVVEIVKAGFDFVLEDGTLAEGAVIIFDEPTLEKLELNVGVVTIRSLKEYMADPWKYIDLQIELQNETLTRIEEISQEEAERLAREDEYLQKLEQKFTKNVI